MLPQRTSERRTRPRPIASDQAPHKRRRQGRFQAAPSRELVRTRTSSPPEEGPSIRYQTSSIRKNANPTSPAAVNTNTGLVGWRDSVAFDWRGDFESVLNSGVDLEM